MQIPGFGLSGKTAIVTGATKGLGYGIVLGLAMAGADVIIASRTHADCERVAKEIRSMGKRALAVSCDVSKPKIFIIWWTHL